MFVFCCLLVSYLRWDGDLWLACSYALQGVFLIVCFDNFGLGLCLRFWVVGLGACWVYGFVVLSFLCL